MIDRPCVYIKVKDINKSIEFYKDLLEIEIDYQNEDRWVNFKLQSGINLALYNIKYDLNNIKSVKSKKDNYSENYISKIEKENKSYERKGNIILNFQVDNLNFEYERIKNLKKAKGISEIMCINFGEPYYFFTVEDLDGNVLEITGKYNEKF